MLGWKPLPASLLVLQAPPLDYGLLELYGIQIYVEGTNPLRAQYE